MLYPPIDLYDWARERQADHLDQAMRLGALRGFPVPDWRRAIRVATGMAWGHVGQRH